MGLGDKKVIDKSDGKISKTRRRRIVLFSYQESSFDKGEPLPMTIFMGKNCKGLLKILSVRFSQFNLPFLTIIYL